MYVEILASRNVCEYSWWVSWKLSWLCAGSENVHVLVGRVNKGQKFINVIIHIHSLSLSLSLSLPPYSLTHTHTHAGSPQHRPLPSKASPPQTLLGQPSWRVPLPSRAKWGSQRSPRDAKTRPAHWHILPKVTRSRGFARFRHYSCHHQHNRQRPTALQSA